MFYFIKFLKNLKIVYGKDVQRRHSNVKTRTIVLQHFVALSLN